MAPGNITVNGNIEATTPGLYGGQVVILAGSTPTSQSGNIDVTGSINTNGANTGGLVTIASMGPNGTVHVAGSLTANGTTNFGSDVNIVAQGTIYVGYVSVAGPNGGFLLASSGVSSGQAISIPSGVYDPAGNIYFVTQQAGQAPVTCSSCASVFNGPPTVDPGADITGSSSATITVQQNDVSYHPGGFHSINTTGTLDYSVPSTNAPVVPIVSDTSISVGSISGGAFNSNYMIFTSPGSFSAGNSPGIELTAYSTGGTVTVPGSLASALVYGSQGVTLPTGASVNGVLLAVAPNGGINLGATGNQSGNSINSSGASGGYVRMISGNNINDYDVPILVNGTTGPAGNIFGLALSGEINLYNYYNAGTSTTYNATLTANSSSGAAGAISLIGVKGISVQQDTGSGTGPLSQSITANGSTGSGLVTLSAPLGSIALSNVSIASTGSLSVQSGGNINVSSASLSSSATVMTTTGAVNPSGGTTIVNNGTISETNTFSVTSSTALTLAGNGSYLVTGSGSPSIVFAVNGPSALSITGSNTFDAGSSGSITFNAQSAGASVNLAGATTQTANSALTINTPSLNFLGDQANISLTGSVGMTVNAGSTGSALTVTTAGGGTNTISGSGNNTVTFQNFSGQAINFVASGTNSTLALSGVQPTVSATSTTGTNNKIFVGLGETIQNSGSSTLSFNVVTGTLDNCGTISSGGDVLVSMNKSGSNLNNTFINGGTIQSAASGNSIQVLTNGNLLIQGAGVFNQTNPTPGTTLFSSAAAGPDTVLSLLIPSPTKP